MKNKTVKNLIALAISAIFVFSANSLFAYYDDSYYTGYAVRDNYSQKQQLLQQQYAYSQQQLSLQNQLAQQQYDYDRQQIIQQQNILRQKQQLEQQKQLASVQQPYTYTQSQIQYVPAQQTVQYVAQPTTTQIQYVPQQPQVQYVAQPNIQYVPASSQGASAVRANTTTYVNNTNPSNPATGQYVSYDNNMLGASAYGYNGYGNGQVLVDPSYDPNGVAALSMNGSGGFLPSSVFQWFMFILLMLAIVIVVRIIIRKRAQDNVHGSPTH